MTRTKIDLSPERQLVTHLIMSKQFAQEIFPILDASLLKTRYAQIVSKWVREYWDRFGDVPTTAIQDIYLEKKASIRDTDEQQSVGEFLQNLSDSYQPDGNIAFYTDQAEKYLKTLSLEKAVAEIQAALNQNAPHLAEGVVSNYKRVGRPEGDGYSLTDSPGDIISAFTEDSEIALEYPGPLGKVVGPCRRGDLNAFIAPMKRGKTWALLYSALEAMAQNKKVVFITLEMPKAQILRRAWQALTGSPKADTTVVVPYYAAEKEPNEPEPDKWDMNAGWRVELRDVNKKAVPLTDIADIQKSIKTLNRGGDCRFVPMPSKATTVKDIEVVVDNLRYYDNYNTDVLVIDYADLLGAKGNEYRHQLDDIWSNLKRMAQERDILVLTATQTNRGGLSGEDLTLENTAEDIRKLAHVSKLIALNQTNEERKLPVMRWKVLIDRDERYSSDEAHTTQCLSIGKFVLDSRIRETVKR